MAHAKLPPSSAHRWLRCPASVEAEAPYPDTSSAHADEGTLAHEYAERLLRLELGGNDGADVEEFYAWRRQANPPEEMQKFAGYYAQAVLEYARGIDGDLHVEHRIAIGAFTGEEGAHGTADAVIVAGDGSELQVHDLKYGRGVEVSAEENEQLMLYALGALEEFDLWLNDDARVVLVIHQPRLGIVSEWSPSREALQEFAMQVQQVGESVELGTGAFCAGEKQCRWCKHKANCEAAAAYVQQTVGADFDVITATEGDVDFAKPEHMDGSDLASKMAAVDYIESWCKAVRAEVERRLLAGEDVDGFKLVQGRKGSRAWANEEDVTELFKSFRLKKEEMYDLKLISPTSAEKLLKDQPKRWSKVQALISQAEGKPSVAPASDKRAALVVGAAADDFDDLTN